MRAIVFIVAKLSLLLALSSPVIATTVDTDEQRWKDFVELYRSNPEDLVAQRELLSTIEQHHKTSAGMLARMLVNGEGGEAEPAKGLALFELSAKLGDAQSAYFAYLGHSQYWSPTSVSTLAAPFLWQAAERNVNDSHDQMVKGYLYGLYGLPQSPEAARSWVYGHGSSVSDEVKLELCLQFDHNYIEISCIEQSLIQAAKAGDGMANYRMGRVSQYGLGRSHKAENIDAELYFEKALPEWQALDALYELYTNSKDREFYDPQLARETLEDAQLQGIPYSTELMGRWHLEYGDRREAITLFNKAQSNGHCRAICSLTLSVEAHGEEADILLQQAVFYDSAQGKYQLALQDWEGELPQPISSRGAQDRVSRGISPPSWLLNSNEVMQLWQRASWTPEPVELDERLTTSSCPMPNSYALNLMHESAKQGHIEAMLQLKRHYLARGNSACAMVWLQEAAAFGDTISQIRTGELYHQPNSSSPLMSYWYSKAHPKLAFYKDSFSKISGLSDPRPGLMPKWIWEESSVDSGSRYHFPTPHLFLFADGGMSLPSHLVPFWIAPEKLKVNNVRVWPTHCGYLSERATGEFLFLGDQDKGQCFPARSEQQRLERVGVQDVVSNVGSTAVLLADGSVLAWGAVESGGAIIRSNLAMFDDEKFTDLDQELALYQQLGDNVVELAASQHSLLARKKDGTVFIWGSLGGAWENIVPGRYQSISARPDQPMFALLTDDGEVVAYHEGKPRKRHLLANNQKKISLPVEGNWTVFAIDDRGIMSELQMLEYRREGKWLEQPKPGGRWSRLGQRYFENRFYTVAQDTNGQIHQFIAPVDRRTQDQASKVYPLWRTIQLDANKGGITWL